MPRRVVPLLERFWAKVNKDGPTMPHMDTPCWVWTAATRNRYGVFGVTSSRTVYAHRFAWTLENVGPVPDGMFVLHGCDHRCCVRPSHLYLGTAAQNTREFMGRGVGLRTQLLRLRHRQTILTEAQVVEARARVAAGQPLKPIAREMGVNYLTLYGAVKRKTWRHVA